MRRFILFWGVFIMIFIAATGQSIITGMPVNSAFASSGGWQTLKAEFPDFEKLEKNPEYYKYKDFPRIRYKRIDVEKWAKNLKPLGNKDKKETYVAVWRSGGKVRFVKIKDPYGKSMAFYSIEKDRIQSAGLLDDSRLFMTQVGVVRVAYYYKNGKVDEIVYHRSYPVMSMKKQNPGDKKYGNIYAIDRIEYYKGLDVPRRIYRYWNKKNMEKGKWGVRVDYDKRGKLVKTVHANEE